MIAIYEDTRQQRNKHNNIKQYCITNNIKLIIKKLDVGDYELVGDGRITVDTKKDICELLTCLSGDKARFYRECERALKLKKKLIILVENKDGIARLEDVARWKNPNYSKKLLHMCGRSLMDEIYKCKVMFGVEFEFCTPDETGKRLIDILTH
jgi:ribosome-associated protein